VKGDVCNPSSLPRCDRPAYHEVIAHGALERTVSLSFKRAAQKVSSLNIQCATMQLILLLTVIKLLLCKFDEINATALPRAI
jgi:hypothetical protein